MPGSQPQASQSSVMTDDGDDNEMGHDDLDDEIFFGQLRGNIVGIQYYSGTVSCNHIKHLSFIIVHLAYFKVRQISDSSENLKGIKLSMLST